MEIDNFYFSESYNVSSMFYNCSKLISLNLYNFDLSSSIDYSNMLNQCNDHLIYCINNDELIKSYLSNFTYINNCSYFCFKKSKKMIYKTNECLDNCYNNSYEYKKML